MKQKQKNCLTATLLMNGFRKEILRTAGYQDYYVREQMLSGNSSRWLGPTALPNTNYWRISINFKHYSKASRGKGHVLYLADIEERGVMTAGGGHNSIKIKDGWKARSYIMNLLDIVNHREKQRDIR